MMGGRLLILIKSSHSYAMRSDLKVINHENLTIEIRKRNSKSFLVATTDRPPCSLIDLFSSYESFISKFDPLDLQYYPVRGLKL